MAARQHIPVSFLRECFEYDPASGIVRWRERPREHFPNAKKGWNSWNAHYADKPAGSPDKDGYLQLALTYNGKQFRPKAHHVAFALMTGAWPASEVDHCNRNQIDNRWENLVSANRQQNCWNTGARGTYRRKNGRFTARIGIPADTPRGKTLINLGTYSTEEEAHQAYLAAKNVYHV